VIFLKIAELRPLNRVFLGGSQTMLYGQVVDAVEREVRRTLGARIREPTLWTAARAQYTALVASRSDRELAETFFNSVTRRIFSTVGVDPAIEFVDPGAEERPAAPGPCRRPGVRTFRRCCA
jgi:isocitrate dehydrogenase kinase/phosphatase